MTSTVAWCSSFSSFAFILRRFLTPSSFSYHRVALVAALVDHLTLNFEIGFSSPAFARMNCARFVRVLDRISVVYNHLLHLFACVAKFSRAHVKSRLS